MVFNLEEFLRMTTKDIKNICDDYGIKKKNDMTLEEIIEKLNSGEYVKKCDMYLIPIADSMYRPPMREKFPQSLHENAKNWILWDCFNHNNTRFKILKRYESDDKIKEIYKNCDPIFHTSFVLLKANYIRNNIEFLIKELKKEYKIRETTKKWHSDECVSCKLSLDTVIEYQ